MINKTNIRQCWYLKLLAVLCLSVFWTVGLNRNHVLAQSNIVPDDTLGEERSRVVPFNGNIDTIQGGAVRGSNLFHSFREFNIGADKGAYFFSPNAEIQNMLARVTGRNPSEILGVLGTRVFDGNAISTSNANLFLINPNGIVFGENASLDVGGSFVATTADGIGFGEQGVFNAINPQVPQILSVNPSAFLFNQIAAQPIVNKSRVANSINTSITDGLRVPDDKSLILLGGDISLDGGLLNAVGGKIEIGGLAASGVVNLNVDGNNLDVTFPDNVEYSDILLQNQAFINTSGSGGGEIQIQGNNVTLKDNSNISSFTNDGRDGKEINIKATRLDILGTSNIQTGAISTGNSGNISIKTRNLNILNGGQISASSFNQGAGGNIEIDADTVEIIGVSTNGTSPSGIGSETVGVNSSSNAGNVTLNTRILNIRDGGILSTQTINQGKGGDLILTARESLNINGFAPSNRPGSQFFISALSTSAGGLGKAGNLKISNTGTIKIENGGQISASSFNQGAGGNIEINADTVEIIGVSTNGILRSGIGNETSGVNYSANAGNITLDTRILNIRDGGILSTQTINQGKGGDLILTARESLNISGFAPTDSQFFFSGLFTSAGGLGKAGNLKIVDTGTIKIENGGRISASTFAQGNGGNIEIDADTVEIIGVSNNGIVSSGIRNETLGVNSSANAGNLTLNTRILNIRDGGAISTQTFNQGKSGDLTLTAKESLNISGFALSNLPDNQFFFSDLNTSARGLGEAGNLKIVDTGIIKIENGGQISASTFAQGNGGNIEIDADTVEIIGVSCYAAKPNK
ncbi:MAG: filamentous hemagglutinin N-terminal domain-containing protein [Richelia sp. RM2_1_2]|nr:filamentous hemagglutinin N-terminal domain-containing protein [Richelia sp. RM2_1_2]